MIDTLAELLKQFVKAEKSVLDKYDIKHRPTIGEMYEGLTMQLVNKSIFDGYDLYVSTQSFIEGCDTEFDVILAEGIGEAIPYTNSRRYKASQVIAVIQVKKNLTAQELRNSYDNLLKVSNVFQNNLTGTDGGIVSDAFRNICHKELSAYKKGQLNPQEEYIYHSLVMDGFFPLRIVFGYNGHKTEEGLRQTYLDYLAGKTSTENNRINGYSPSSFPNLIISEGMSLVKLSGCPYSLPLSSIKEGWWEVMASTHYNPMHIFLEMLWTKLSYRFQNLPQEIFGDDLQSEPFSQFLRARIHTNTNDSPIGWDYEYTFLQEKVLSHNNDLVEWSPAIIDKAQYVVLGQLSRYDIDISQDKDLELFVLENGYKSLKEFIELLEKLGFVTLDGKTLKLITKQLVCVISPDGNTYAADNYDGRFTHWIIKNEMNKLN